MVEDSSHKKYMCISIRQRSQDAIWNTHIYIPTKSRFPYYLKLVMKSSSKGNSEMEKSESMPSLLNIPWADVLFYYVFPQLSAKDLFNLRAVSKELKYLVTEYFKLNKILDLSSVSKSVTHQAFQIFTKDSKNLRILKLSSCKWLDSALLNPVLEENKYLSQLNISHCSSISNTSLQILAINAPNLRVLNLSNCHWTSAPAIVSISLHCHELESIDLTSCWEVTDEAVCSLAMNCPRLKSLSLSRIYGITDKSLVVLAHKSKLLENLHLAGCWRITDYGVRLVGEYCRQLKSLKIEDCRSVTEMSLVMLRPRIHIDRALSTLCIRLPRLQLQI